MNKQRLMKAIKPGLTLLAIIVLWELASRAFSIPTWLLPAPTQIIEAGVSDWANYQQDLWSTVLLTIIGFVIGTTVGLGVATILHLVSPLREAVYPLLILSQNIPIIVLAPLLVVWFGFGMLPKLIVIALVCFFPITVSAMQGFRETDRDLQHYMAMAGATKQQMFFKLEWPSAIPQVFSGLKISATYSVMGAVISEWLGAQKGIGVYMTMASSSFRTDRVFVAIVLVMALSLLFFGVIILIEKRVVRWKRED